MTVSLPTAEVSITDPAIVEGARDYPIQIDISGEDYETLYPAALHLRDMLAELRDDNTQLAQRMRETHGLCDKLGDVATASFIEIWIDEAEKRAWFLFEASRGE